MRLILAFTFLALNLPAAPKPLAQRPQPWERRDQPILSARNTQESWCKVVLYSPHVIHAQGRFHMWYVGTSSPCVLQHDGKLYLYYSDRDWNREYIGADGKKHRDGSSLYSHIGVAILDLSSSASVHR